MMNIVPTVATINTASKSIGKGVVELLKLLCQRLHFILYKVLVNIINTHFQEPSSACFFGNIFVWYNKVQLICMCQNFEKMVQC